MTAQLPQENGNDGKNLLEIGLDDQRQEDRVAAVTRSTRRQLLIFVGGTGLAVLAAMSQILKERGIKFGDESIAAHKPIVPHAIFVDADIEAIKAVKGDGGFEEESEERKRYRLQIEQLQEMGVKVCNIFNKGRGAFLTITGLGNNLKQERPAEEDPQGCKADPRVGMTRYLSLRETFNENNPRAVARTIVDEWLSTQTAFLAEETLLTIVGGLHGGTGQIALPIMADVRRDIERTLRGSRTTLETERYAMTSQSAGIDSSRRNDGLQRKRILNTAAGVILANAAAVQRGFQMTPEEWVDGVPVKFTFIVNGANPHKQVSSDGGHYVPATVIAKNLVSRILGLDLTATGRSNARLEISETKGSSRTPNIPRALFSALGVSELLPCPERARLTMQKKHVLFTAVIGLKDVDQGATGRQLKNIFPDKLLDSALQDAQAPQLLSTQFGDGEEAKLNVETERNRFVGELETNLRPEVKRALKAKAHQMHTDIITAARELKKSCGLATLKSFLQTALERLGSLETEAKAMLDDKCSPSVLSNLDDRGEEVVEEARTKKIKPVNLLFWKLRDKSLQQLNDLLTEVASIYSNYAVCKRDNMYLSELQIYLINPLRQVISSLLHNVELEMATAQTMLHSVKPDPVEMSLKTPFDVETSVHMNLTEDPLQTRVANLGDGNWTQEKMQALLNSLAVTATDIKLFEKLDKGTLMTLEKLSCPLTRPASGDEGHNAATTISTISIPVETKDQADKVPAPTNATRLPIGSDGPLMITQEYHGINALLDDAYVRECLELLLATPPTAEEANLVQMANPSDPELRLKLNRESQFTFTGQAERLLPPVFRALAERQYVENGQRGKIVEKCPGTHCGMPFYVSPEETRAKVACCPGCRRLPKAPTVEAVRKRVVAAVGKKEVAADKKKGRK